MNSSIPKALGKWGSREYKAIAQYSRVVQPVLVAELPDYPGRWHMWWSCYVIVEFPRNIFTRAMPGLAWVCNCLWVQHRFILVLGIKDHSCRIGYSLANSCLHRHSHSLKVLWSIHYITSSEHTWSPFSSRSWAINPSFTSLCATVSKTLICVYIMNAGSHCNWLYCRNTFMTETYIMHVVLVRYVNQFTFAYSMESGS